MFVAEQCRPQAHSGLTNKTAFHDITTGLTPAYGTVYTHVCLNFSGSIETRPDVMPVLQSPWIIDGQRKGVSSVEERIADAVLPAFQADRHKFMSAGMQLFSFESVQATSSHTLPARC